MIKKKAELIEQVEYINAQSRFPEKDRKPGMIKAACAALTQMATTTTVLATA